MDNIEAYRAFLQQQLDNAKTKRDAAPNNNLWFGWAWWAGALSSWDEALEQFNKSFPQ